MQLKSLLLTFIFFTFTISVAADDFADDFYKIEDPPLGPFHTPKTYQPIVRKLKNMIRKNKWEGDFEVAISIAHETGVLEMANIKNLTNYYNFLDYFVKWVPTEVETGTFVYRMICTMYFVLDQNTVKQHQSPIKPNNTLPLTDLSQWMVDFANDMGKFLNTAESINNTTLQTFYTAQNYNVDAYVVPKGGWKTFNEFFARNFTLGSRPINGPSNPAVIVSAADSTFNGCWNIDDNSNVVLKGITWSIKELLNNSIYADDFAGGKFMHAFLAPYDYHRQHAPVSGKVLEAKVIPGQVYLEVTIQTNSNGKLVLKPITIQKMRSTNSIKKLIDFDIPNNLGYQFCQARGLIIIDSPIGKVAILPVGMAQVSSVVLSTKKGNYVKKGDEISYFQFGGSDIVLVFQAQSKVNILANIKKHYRVGEQIAIAHV